MKQTQIQADAEKVIKKYREQNEIISHQLLLSEVIREEYAEEIVSLRQEIDNLRSSLNSHRTSHVAETSEDALESESE